MKTDEAFDPMTVIATIGTVAVGAGLAAGAIKALHTMQKFLRLGKKSEAEKVLERMQARERAQITDFLAKESRKMMRESVIDWNQPVPTVKRDRSWIVRNAAAVQRFTISEGVMIATMQPVRNAAHAVMLILAESEAKAFIAQPIFGGLPVEFDGTTHTVGDPRGAFSYVHLAERAARAFESGPLDEMAKLGARGRSELLRLSKEEGKEDGGSSRMSRAYMSDGVILEKWDRRDAPSGYNPKGRRRPGSWSVRGHVKAELMKNPYDLRDALVAVRDSLVGKGWTVEEDTTTDESYWHILAREAGVPSRAPKLGDKPRDTNETIDPSHEAALGDALLKSIGFNPDGTLIPYARQVHECPSCHETNAYWRELHADTGMDEMVLWCPDCRHDFTSEEVDEETKAEWMARQPKVQVMPGSEKAHAAWEKARVLQNKRKKLKRQGEGHWRTTSGGHRIYIENGKVTKGNPHLLNALKGKDEGLLDRIRGGTSIKPQPTRMRRERGYMDHSAFDSTSRVAAGMNAEELDAQLKKMGRDPRSYRKMPKAAPLPLPKQSQSTQVRHPSYELDPALARLVRPMRDDERAKYASVGESDKDDRETARFHRALLHARNSTAALRKLGYTQAEVDTMTAWMRSGMGKEDVLYALKKRRAVDEVSPPGFKGTVKAMKKHGEIDNPYALAWWLKGRGAKSNYKADGSKKHEAHGGGREAAQANGLRETDVSEHSCATCSYSLSELQGNMRAPTFGHVNCGMFNFEPDAMEVCDAWESEKGEVDRERQDDSVAEGVDITAERSTHGPTYRLTITGSVGKIAVNGHTAPFAAGLGTEVDLKTARQITTVSRAEGGSLPSGAYNTVLRAVMEKLKELESENESVVEDAKGAIGTTILAQLGGQRFIAMTGAKGFIGTSNGLRFKIPRNKSKANVVSITLNGRDTYDVEFIKLASMRAEGQVIEYLEDIHADQLRAVFTRVTGMETSLGTMGRPQESVDEDVRLTLKRDTETDEWVVRWVENGRLNTEKSYYTDDRADAVATMADMQKRLDAQESIEEADALDLKTFEQMGRKAHAAGLKATPMLDRVLMAELRRLTKGKPMGFSVPIIDAWSRGWHAANLKDESFWDRYLSRLDEDEFIVSDRYTALGIPRPDPATMCKGQCEGTGIVPISAEDESEPWHTLWMEVEEAQGPSDDGYHFVKCPDCRGTGKLAEARDPLQTIRVLLVSNPGRAYTLDDLAATAGVDKSEALKAASRLVTQGTAQFSRGEGYSLAGNPGALRLPAKSRRMQLTGQRTLNIQGFGESEDPDYAVVRGSKDNLEYWTGDGWSADRKDAKVFDTKEQSDAEADELDGTDETVTSAFVGGFNRYPLGRAKTPGDVGSIPDVYAPGANDFEEEDVDETSEWGRPYAEGAYYRTPDDQLVSMRRKGQAVRFYTDDGTQVGPEQRNVAPAVVYARENGWREVPDVDEAFARSSHYHVVNADGVIVFSGNKKAAEARRKKLGAGAFIGVSHRKKVGDKWKDQDEIDALARDAEKDTDVSEAKSEKKVTRARVQASKGWKDALSFRDGNDKQVVTDDDLDYTVNLAQEVIDEIGLKPKHLKQKVSRKYDDAFDLLVYFAAFQPKSFIIRQLTRLKGSDESMDPHEPESVARSLSKARRDTDAHRTRYRTVLNQLPDGTNINGWVKTTIVGDVFWQKTIRGREKTVADVLVEVGQKAADAALRKAGRALPESMGVGDSSIEVVKRGSRWFVVPPDGTKEAPFDSRASAVAYATSLAKREHYTVVVTMNEARLDEKLTDFQIDVTVEGGDYVVEFPELRGPVGSGYQNEYRFSDLNAALSFARPEAARQNFIIVVWNVKPEDATVPIGIVDVGGRVGNSDYAQDAPQVTTEVISIPEAKLETFVLAAQAAEVPLTTPVSFSSGYYTLTLPGGLAERVRALVGPTGHGV